MGGVTSSCSETACSECRKDRVPMDRIVIKRMKDQPPGLVSIQLADHKEERKKVDKMRDALTSKDRRDALLAVMEPMAHKEIFAMNKNESPMALIDLELEGLVTSFEPFDCFARYAVLLLLVVVALMMVMVMVMVMAMVMAMVMVICKIRSVNQLFMSLFRLDQTSSIPTKLTIGEFFGPATSILDVSRMCMACDQGKQLRDVSLILYDSQSRGISVKLDAKPIRRLSGEFFLCIIKFEFIAVATYEFIKYSVSRNSFAKADPKLTTEEAQEYAKTEQQQAALMRRRIQFQRSIVRESHEQRTRDPLTNLEAQQYRTTNKAFCSSAVPQTQIIRHQLDIN
ncbi:hypothetical protein GUITHDRAFT_122238, partial [Guillardia theta CCMP2712]